LAVPEVAHNLKFSSLSFFAKFRAFFLSLSLTDIKAVPAIGSSLPRPSDFLQKINQNFHQYP